MLKTRVEEIRKILSKFVLYEKGEKLRWELETIARESYIPTHAPKTYLNFIARHECSFERCSAQDSNSPYTWQLFTCISQHVYGDCIQECLDKAISVEKSRKFLDCVGRIEKKLMKEEL